MSLAAGYLLAELLSEADGVTARVSAPLRDRIDAKRAALAGLTRKQRAATLVAALRSPPAKAAPARLATKVWQRLCDPKVAYDERVRRELEELGDASGDAS